MFTQDPFEITVRHLVPLAAAILSGLLLVPACGLALMSPMAMDGGASPYRGRMPLLPPIQQVPVRRRGCTAGIGDLCDEVPHRRVMGINVRFPPVAAIPSGFEANLALACSRPARKVAQCGASSSLLR
ncbi:MAG: hypothetical protein E6G94_02395 [Alphaproteobacteria bacterium]|nr:MAG: hypothetical protein E6G94_02395 [Alphaproteobacteria bacterium]